MNALAKRIPNLVGGSADLNPSTDTALKGFGDFQPAEFGGPGTQGAVGGEWDYGGRNMAFGVREHAMGAAVNGMAAHGGLLPFSATFLVFSDYMKPAIRLGALSQLKVFYVFTHDSIGCRRRRTDARASRATGWVAGDSGPDRDSPGGCHRNCGCVGLRRSAQGPDAVRADAPEPAAPRSQPGAKSRAVAKGAYILSEAQSGAPEVILIGTGSEVAALHESAGAAAYPRHSGACSQHAELEFV